LGWCRVSLVFHSLLWRVVLLGSVGWSIVFKKKKLSEAKRKSDEQAAKPEKEKVETLLPLDLVELEVGYGLINIVESNQSGDLLERIVSIRKQFALDMGIIVPSIHIRDNLQLEPGEYRVLIKGNRVGGGTLRPDYLMAMDPGNTTARVDGIPTREPAFGLDALWIGKSSREEAELAGYTVVDLPTVMATHLTEIVRTHAHELLGRQEVAGLG
jgi:flagellar biosynthesis protein FlhA